MALGVPRIQAVQVGSEESRLIAACTRANFNDGIAPVIGIARDQKFAGTLLEFLHLHVEFAEFCLCQLDQIRVFPILNDLPGFLAALIALSISCGH